MDEKKGLKDESNISIVEKNRKGRKPGTPKTGGREAGTPNKKTLVFAEAIEAAGFNLEQAIVSLFNSTSDEYIKLALINMVAKYKLPVPKPREVDVEDEDDSNPVSESVNILALTNEKS